MKLIINNRKIKSNSSLSDILNKTKLDIQVKKIHNKFHGDLSDKDYITKNEPAIIKLHKRYITQGRFQSLLLLAIFLLCTLSAWLVKANAVHNAKLQEGIADDIIRFHVIANSDSTSDQALKLTVKDTLVKSLSPILSNTETIEEARALLTDNLDFIQKTAEDTIRQNGYSYPVTVALEKCYFPLKIYGEYAFPPGNYEALRVQIGAAEGKNWWCVMFPPLCFVDETYSVVDEKSGKKLKKLLTDEEYEALIKEKKPVKIKFKLWEKIKKLFS